MIELIRTLYNYSAWANTRILDTAAQLSAEQFAASVGASYPSVQDTLVHTLSAQIAWLYRFQGKNAPPVLVSADFPDLATLRGRWDAVEAETQAFVAGLDDAALNAEIRVVDRAGNTNHYILWQIMMHQANHATQHRSEVAAMLTQFGYSPGDLDLLDYVEMNS